MANKIASELLDNFANIYQLCKDKDKDRVIYQVLLNIQINRAPIDSDDSNRRFYEWSKHHPRIRVGTAVVPYSILSEGVEASLHDIKVFAHGPDDALYDASEELRKKVARGNCLLELHKGSDIGMSCVIYALKKFTGGLGDDDDRDKGDNHTWKRYFIKPMEEAQTIICTKKANGEAAHLSAIRISGIIYMCAGSKNVHLLFRSREDIALYIGDRYRIANDVCQAVMDLIESMSEDKKDRLLEFLCDSKLTGVFEILCPDHQHVVDLSYLPRSELRFISWTSNNLEPPIEQELCCMPPHVAIEISRALGLPTVEYSVIPVSQVDAKMKEIRQGYNYEGEVLYFLDSSHMVIGILKKKTIWYILCRAIREKVKAAVRDCCKNPNTYQPAKAIKKTVKRLHEIQSWLGIDDDSLKIWIDLAEHFIKWCALKVPTGPLNAETVTDMFPVTWKEFLSETGKTDQIEVQFKEPLGSDE